MEVLFEGCYHEHILWHALKMHAFCKAAATFHRCSLKQLAKENVCGGLYF